MTAGDREGKRERETSETSMVFLFLWLPEHILYQWRRLDQSRSAVTDDQRATSSQECPSENERTGNPMLHALETLNMSPLASDQSLFRWSIFPEVLWLKRQFNFREIFPLERRNETQIYKSSVNLQWSMPVSHWFPSPPNRLKCLSFLSSLCHLSSKLKNMNSSSFPSWIA